MNCDICFEEFNNLSRTPEIIYDCFHTFCKICIKKLKECPSCRKAIILHNTNYYLLRFLVEDDKSLEILRQEISIYLHDYIKLLNEYNKSMDTKKKEIGSNFHKILNKKHNHYAELIKTTLKIKDDLLYKYQNIAKFTLEKLDTGLNYRIPHFTYQISESNQITVDIVANDTLRNYDQMEKVLIKEQNKIMDLINKHYSNVIARITIEKNKVIETIKQNNKEMISVFEKKFDYIEEKNYHRQILLIDLLSQDEMQTIKSNKNDKLLKMTQNINNLKLFNTEISF